MIVDEEAVASPLKPYRWMMLALLWLMYFTFGLVLRSTSPLVTPILKDLGISYSQMGIVLGSWQFIYIAVAIIAGIVIDKWGVRNSLFFGMLIISLSAILRYFARGFGTLLLIVSLFGLGGPMISIGAPKTISLWFWGRSRGTAVGIYTTGPRIGGMVALCATNGFVMPLTGYSWRLTFVCYGAFALAVALLWVFLAMEKDPSEAMESTPINKIFLRLIKTQNVRVVLMAGLFSFTIMHGFTNWLPKILENTGLSPKMAGFAAATPLLAGIPSILFIPRLVPPRSRGRCVALLAFLSAAGILSVTASVLPLLVGLIVFGASGSALSPLLMLTLMEIPEVGSKYMGSAGGIFFCIAEIGGFLGPFVVGSLFDLTGTFLSGASCLASLGLFIMVLTSSRCFRP